MNAPPFPINPAVGEFFGNWCWNGQRWVCTPAAGVRVVTQVFKASGPYMPSPGLVTAVVECIGGGGAGGAASGGVTLLVVGGGGGSGGYSRITLAAALVAGGVQVTIGEGAAPPAGGNQPFGGDTTFGALCVAHGGQSGMGNAEAVGIYGLGGRGAPAGVGDIALSGNAGATGAYTIYTTPLPNATSGARAGSMWGGASMVSDTNWGSAGAGVAGDPNTGAGGTGAVSNQMANGEANGGAGGSGLCIVTEYCWSDSGTDDCLNPPVNVNARVAVTHVPWQGPGPCPPGWGGQALDFEEG